MIRVARVTVALALGLLAGCSSKPPGASVPPDLTLLQEVNDLLRAGGPPGRLPGKVSDLDRAKEMFPRAYETVKSGKVVVLWGAPTQGEGDVGKDEKVVAYEKQTPTEGGYVLLSAGSVTKMTAEEFKAAPKAAGKQ